jgi:F-type H+-transporting ATPase subunit epsilon
MLPQHIHLEIVNPEKLLFSGEVDSVSLPGKGGYLGILPGHAPLLSELQIGEIRYKRGQEIGTFSCCKGFVEVLPDKVSVLADVAERPEDISIERAREAKQRAEQRLRSKDHDIDFERAQQALRRALMRLDVASRHDELRQPRQ